MRRSKGIVVAGIVVIAVGVVVGAALAVADEQSKAEDPGVVVSKLYAGVAPSGRSYELSEVEFSQFSDGLRDRLFCYEVAADGLRARGCIPREREAEVSRVGQAMLGNDVFVAEIADAGATGLRVSRQDGRGTGVSGPVVDLGSARLVHAVLHAPQETLPKTDFGIPVPPDIKVETVDANGLVQHEEIVSVPKQGTGKIPGHDPSDGRHVLGQRSGP